VTAAAPTAAIRAVAARTRVVSADALALGVLGVAAVVMLYLTWSTWGDVGSDTGYDLVAASRVAHGQLPYVDFTYYYGPLGPFVLGAFALVGGSGIAPAVALGLLLTAAIVLATYRLARRATGPLGAFLAAAIVMPVALGPSNFSYVLPHSESAPLGILGVLCLLLALGAFEDHGRRRSLVAAGAAVGLVALTRPEFALAAYAAAALWLLLRARSRTLGRRDVALLAAPALGIPAVVYGAFLGAVSPHRLLFENLYPTAALRAGGNHVLRISAPLTAASFEHLAARFLLYAAGACALALLARALERPGTLRRPLALTASAGAVAILAVAAAYPERVRYGLEFVYGGIPLGAALALAFVLWRTRAGAAAAAAAADAAGLVALAVLAAKTYAAFFVESSQPQVAMYVLPLAACLLVRVHLKTFSPGRVAPLLGAGWLAFLAVAGAGLVAKDALAESWRVRGPGGTLAAHPADAVAYNEALHWILEGSAPGKPVLLAPQLTALYALSDRTDPVPSISLLPNALPTAASQRAAIAQLDRQHIQLAIVDERTYPEYGHTRFGESFDRLVAAWIKRKFVYATTLHGYGPSPRKLDVYVLRARPSADDAGEGNGG
jgi:hypothetical protein